MSILNSQKNLTKANGLNSQSFNDETDEYEYEFEETDLNKQVTDENTNFIPEEDKDKERDREKFRDNLKNVNTVMEEEFLKKISSDPFYMWEKKKIEDRKLFGDKEYKEFQLNPDLKTQGAQREMKAYFDEKYYFDYKKKQFDRHKAYLESEEYNVNEKAESVRGTTEDVINSLDRLQLNFSIMVKMKRGQDEVTDDVFMEEHFEEGGQQSERNVENSDDDESDKEEKDENEENNKENQDALLEKQEAEELCRQQYNILKYTSGCPVENSVLVDISKIEETNNQLQNSYNDKMSSEKTNRDHTQMKQYLTLENELLQVLTLDIALKMKYLKLTRVTKKIQEVVTGKEDINQAQIAKLYEDKKRNLEENTAKRIATLDKKLREINTDIRKKVEENTAFEYKLKNLSEDVKKTQQIIELDNNTGGDDLFAEEDQHNKNAVANKSLEIAEVSKLKSIVKNYYEEIEYLRAELDKLRARTFPSFLQKPDTVIYPDEK